MPTLRRWFEHEYARLEAEGKAGLVAGFEAFTQAYFEGDTVRAFPALDELSRLAASLDEPLWQAVLDYYAAAANINWRGDIAQGLQLATQAVVRSSRLNGNPVPALYAREVALYAWLSTDGPGYAGPVIEALDEVPAAGLPRDVVARFGLVRAHALAHLGRGEEAARAAAVSVPYLEWPRAFELCAAADSLLWRGRWDQAAHAYRQAARAFDQHRWTVEANATLLGSLEAALRAGDLAEALRALPPVVERVERGINQAHRGMAYGLHGRALLAQGAPDEAAAWLELALAALDGLGWLRLEAELALSLLKAIVMAGLPVHHPWREQARTDAEARTLRLASRDLDVELEALAAGRAA
jgi:tetratricopeptide (TPR) repeat protein